jgi:hypothetical protein
MDEAMYTLQAGGRSYRGTAKELEAIRTMLKQGAQAHWAAWGKLNGGSIRDPSPYPLEKTA